MKSNCKPKIKPEKDQKCEDLKNSVPPQSTARRRALSLVDSEVSEVRVAFHRVCPDGAHSGQEG